jgi:hypothetical protein
MSFFGMALHGIGSGSVGFLIRIAMRDCTFLQNQSSLLGVSLDLRTFLARSPKSTNFLILNFTAFNLFFQIHRDVAEASHLTGQTALIDKIIGSNQAHFGLGRRHHIVFAFDDTNATFGTARNAFADGFDFNSIF